MNTRQQTDRDPKKGNKNLGTFQQMCQVYVFFNKDHVIVWLMFGREENLILSQLFGKSHLCFNKKN